MKKGLKAWVIVRSIDGSLLDDACGDGDAMYPIWKTKKSALDKNCVILPDQIT